MKGVADVVVAVDFTFHCFAGVCSIPAMVFRTDSPIPYQGALDFVGCAGFTVPDTPLGVSAPVEK
jgi:hypothetical protein